MAGVLSQKAAIVITVLVLFMVGMYLTMNARETVFVPEEAAVVEPIPKEAAAVVEQKDAALVAEPMRKVAEVPQPMPLQPMPATSKLITFNTFATRTDEQLLSSAWVGPLRQLLREVNLNNQVMLMFTSQVYTENSLNWLVSARVRTEPPVTNAIVMCYDQEVFDLIHTRGISSILIEPKSLVDVKTIKFRNYLRVLRLIVLRLVNHWGYDVVQIDADAIVLKNPQELLQQHPHSDIVSSAGTYPHEQLEAWKLTLCTGFILIRSTPKTGTSKLCFCKN